MKLCAHWPAHKKAKVTPPEILARKRINKAWDKWRAAHPTASEHERQAAYLEIAGRK